jgi:hypothetical protein
MLYMRFMNVTSLVSSYLEYSITTLIIFTVILHFHHYFPYSVHETHVQHVELLFEEKQNKNTTQYMLDITIHKQTQVT